MHPDELLKQIEGGRAPIILDVRSGYEYAGGHIKGAIHAPTLRLLFGGVDIPGDKGDQLVITCEHGPRAVMAKRVLEMRGYQRISLLAGHMSAWRNAGRPLVKP